MKSKHINVFIFSLFILFSSSTIGQIREKYNFNSDWLLQVGDLQGNELDLVANFVTALD